MAATPPGRVAEAKAALRRAVLARRDGLGPETRRAQGAAIFAGIARLPAVVTARVVLGYCSFGSEPDTRGFLDRVLADGRVLGLPRVDRDRGVLTLHRVTDLGTQLCAGVWGIREPDPARCPALSPDEIGFVLVPGVAFDRAGGRLGYGGGYYDRLLARLGGRVALVAAAFEVQLVPAVPMEAGDRRVDLVVTETGRYPASGTRGAP